MSEGVEQKLILLQQRLDTHIADFDRHKDEEDSRWRHLIDAQETTTLCVRELTSAITMQAESTSGMVDAWKAGTGAVKTITWLGKTTRWFVGAGVTLAAGWMVVSKWFD